MQTHWLYILLLLLTVLLLLLLLLLMKRLERHYRKNTVEALYVVSSSQTIHKVFHNQTVMSRHYL